MINKISLTNKFGAFIFSLIVIPALFISIFTLPVELIVFNPESYMPVLDQTVYKEEFPKVVSELLSNQLFNLPINNRTEFDYQQKMSTALVKYLPTNWLDSVAASLIKKGIEYFNFKTPYDSIEVDISEFKDSILQNSNDLSADYLISLNSCSEAEERLFGNGQAKLVSVPTCRPSSDKYDVVLLSLNEYMLDRVNQLHPSINVLGVIPAQMVSGQRFFYFYSIARWAFRLLPFITIILLIVIAQLLRKNKKLMRRWSGVLLVAVPACILIGILIIMIGFDQFIGLIFKQYFSKVIAGFGQVLLWMMATTGRQVLLSTAGVAVVVALFGLILLLFAKFTKTEMREELQAVPDVSEIEKIVPQKEIVPETIEEIEKQESKIKKGKK